MTGREIAALLPVLAIAAGVAIAAPSPFSPRQSAAQKDVKKSADSMTGCVDERNGEYVLTDDRELNPIAKLEADGFPREGFAKHMGHKVTVRGASTPGDPLPTFKVRSIATVNETCASQRH